MNTILLFLKSIFGFKTKLSAAEEYLNKSVDFCDLEARIKAIQQNP